MLEIYRDSNEETVVDNINRRNTSSLTSSNSIVLRQGTEDTCKDVSFGHFETFNSKREGDECSSKDAKSTQDLISTYERSGDGGTERDVSLGHSRINNVLSGDECSSKDAKLRQKLISKYSRRKDGGTKKVVNLAQQPIVIVETLGDE